MRKYSASMSTHRFGLALAIVAVAVMPACGGGKGGSGPGGAGQGLVLISFLQDAVDNVALNTRLEFRFSEAVDPSTITTSSIQIRQGNEFGAGVPGTFRIEGSTVIFEPRLPGLCDLSDSGFEGDTQYRVQLIGSPEEFAIRNTQGQPLRVTSTYEFHTRLDSDPERFTDQIAGFGPSVVEADSSPNKGDQALSISNSNQIVIGITENIDPCTIDATTVQFDMFETGDTNLGTNVAAPNGNASGFYRGTSTADSNPSSFSWGADVFTTINPAQRVLSNIELRQTFTKTEIIITPTFGQFPENALLVLRLTSSIQDFGGQPLVPYTLTFTTENRPAQNGTYALLADGETPFLDNLTTSDVNSARAPSRIQGYLLFAGDGDNGSVLTIPSSPFGTNPNICSPNQVNSGTPSKFEPLQDVILNTGASVNACVNQTDGSTAVVWEFDTFRIASGVTVRFIGVNPAIILVKGDVVIETGGRLLVRGDNTAGVPQSNGGNGEDRNTNVQAADGGEGVAGGGDGGGTRTMNGQQAVSSEDGFSAYGTGEYMTQSGLGAGQGNIEVQRQTTNWNNNAGTAAAGGGGGHGTEGGLGTAVTPAAPHTYTVTPRGAGGVAYPATDNMLTPSAGSGGGGGGGHHYTPSSTDTFRQSSGGAGGAGGGFIDLTSSGNITVGGLIDAAGARGGSGIPIASLPQWGASAGGGGGAGGGIRLLTPNAISVVGGAVSAAGGNPGATNAGVGGVPVNQAGAGGLGRIVFEDGDSVIGGLGTAAVTPGEGTPGFFRSTFNAGRFKGGGTMPQALSDLVPMGPLNPDFQVPVQADFVAGIPPIASVGFGATGIFVEAQGFDILPDGTADMSSGTGFATVGYFRDSGSEDAPTWVPSMNPADVTLPSDNVGGTMNSLDGKEFLQFRITFYLVDTVGPFDPGPFIDTWNVNFVHDQ